ncbi:MAG: CBS domain-containing protein [Gammaproteobacteria bacterium]|nr:CBS domain-containing protein [Gammaproteobacteria bacterium]
MSSSYQTLSYVNIESDTTYQRPAQNFAENVTAESPAVDVMTDFTKIAAITMGPCGTLEAAEKRMIASGVRLLLVVDQSNQILGVITLTDLQGSRPMKYIQEAGGTREDIFLRDIMTKSSQIEALPMKVVELSRVGDIVATMKHSNRQHALVVDHDENNQQVIRGIFSTKQISIQLGLDYRAKETREIFEELEAIL